MATHELYVGGPSRTGGNFNRSQYPAPAYSNASAAFKAVVPAVHKEGGHYPFSRVLDFANDHALAEYFRNLSPVVAAADVLDIQLIPANVLLYGLWVNVETPVAGLSLTFSMDDGTTFGGAALDCSVANVGQMSAPNGVAWVTAGALSLATANFNNNVRMLRATVTAMGAAKFGSLRMTAIPLFSHLAGGQF